MLKQLIPYQADSAALFARIQHLPWAIWLDSGYVDGISNSELNNTAANKMMAGRYDVMVADPFCRVGADQQRSWIEQQGDLQYSPLDPFELLKQTLAAYPQPRFELPFEGGAVGYFAYDLGYRIEQFSRTQSPCPIPTMQVGIYDWALVVDHQLRQSYLVSHQHHPATAQQWPQLVELLTAPMASGTTENIQPFSLHGEVQSNLTESQYAQAFQAIQQYIHAGDCYQVNLAQRFRIQASGDAFSTYCALRQLSPAPFMAMMNLGTAKQPLQILSASPERFLRVLGGAVETRPIKGTRARLAQPDLDAAQADQLKNSRKDQAENLMIVDLLRNDLGKVCEIGSVQVSELFKLESYANVHHLVSTVRGKLAAGKSAIDLLRACFPGGSITGAPKLRAMQIIEALEPDARGVYCGAIAYIGFDGNMDSNIPIRTAVYQQGQFDFWAGGGIVADSELAKEYQETWDKASAMLKLISQLSQS